MKDTRGSGTHVWIIADERRSETRQRLASQPANGRTPLGLGLMKPTASLSRQLSALGAGGTNPSPMVDVL